MQVLEWSLPQGIPYSWEAQQVLVAFLSSHFSTSFMDLLWEYKWYNNQKSEVLVAQLCQTLCNPMDYTAHQAPLSMEFSRQEYWGG